MVAPATMRVLGAVLVAAIVASLVVGVLAVHRHRSHHHNGLGSNATTEERMTSRRGLGRRGGRGHHDHLQTAFESHMDRVKGFRCREPVPMALLVLSLQGEMTWRPTIHEEFEPERTILHRCGDASGCCQNHAFSCQPIEFQEVTLVFTVWDTRTATRRYKEVTATNHTLCDCLERSDQPK